MPGAVKLQQEWQFLPQNRARSSQTAAKTGNSAAEPVQESTNSVQTAEPAFFRSTKVPVQEDLAGQDYLTTCRAGLPHDFREFGSSAVRGEHIDGGLDRIAGHVEGCSSEEIFLSDGNGSLCHCDRLAERHLV